MQLELVAFGPYVDGMDEPDEARKEYAKRLFRGGDEDYERPSDDHTTMAQSVGEFVLDNVLKK